MLAALGAVGAEVYSLGEPNCPFPGAGGACGSLPANAGVELGEPNTFGFGFVTTSADVSITNTDSPDPVTVGGSLTYTLHVHNAGPNAAAAVTVTDTLPAGVSFESATTTAGSCAGANTITCALGTLASGADATVTIVVAASAAGSSTTQPPWKPRAPIRARRTTGRQQRRPSLQPATIIRLTARACARIRRRSGRPTTRSGSSP